MNRMRAFPDAEPDSGQTLAKLNSIQEQLDDLRGKLVGHPNNEHVDAVPLGQLAREIVRSRKRRAAVFGEAGLFGEPAWDILLGLYVAAEAQQKLTVSDVCKISGVPQSTALRWLEKLERDGWVSRDSDPVDRRRFWILLTERSSNSIRTFLAGISLRPNPE